MTIIPVRLGGRSYEVAVGRGLLGGLAAVAAVASQLRNRRILAVSDRTVHELHGPPLEVGLDAAGAKRVGWVVLEPGEAHKNLESLCRIWDALVAGRIERGDCLIAFGGGVVGDVAGFAAATYLRGVDFVQIPTTLLAMVDSSVGGKTAIDHPRGKNLIGAFHQPRGVAADLDVLRTLPRRELLSGFAEVIKSAIVADPELFDLLERRGPAIAEDDEALEETVARAVAVKARIVEQDEREGGPRALLNLGHTLGHAVEVLSGFGTHSHGEAVVLGIAFAVRLSRELGLLSTGEAVRIRKVLANWGYPLKVPGFPVEKILETLGLDKKSVGGLPRWVVLRGIGEPEFGLAVPPELIQSLLPTVQEGL